MSNHKKRTNSNQTQKKTVNIKHYKTKRELNIGVVIFVIILVYLIVTVFTYAMKKNVSSYEVREGSIVKDNSYTGLVVRDSVVVSAEESGYVSYFQNGNSKVRADSNIYIVSSDKLDTEAPADDEETHTLGQETINNVVLKIQNNNQNFNPQKFSSVYSMKNDISNYLQSDNNRSKTAQLDAIIAASDSNIRTYKAVRDGIVVQTIDGYEGLTWDTLTEQNFDRSDYELKRLKDGMKVAVGDPVYKLITSEDWKVYIQLDQESAEELSSIYSVCTRINQANDTIWANIEVLEKNNKYYACLTYDNSMIRYSDERFLNVELILNNQSGLKIPKSSVVEKDFYIIPADYLTSSGQNWSTGVLVKKGGEIQYQSMDIFYISEDNMAYLDPGALKENTLLAKPESDETYTVKTKQTLEGVYTLNKGYAVFKPVTILCENDEYYIVKEGESYGLSNYDHIAQDGAGISEDEVVFQ